MGRREKDAGTWPRILLGAVVLAGSTVGLSPYPASAATKAISSNQPLYQPGEVATLTGTGFGAGTTYAVPVVLPDGSTMRAQGTGPTACNSTGINCWNKVTADSAGNLIYQYTLATELGTYEARIYAGGWSGNLAATPQASAKFDNARTDFTQCLNDSDNDGVKDDCQWSSGASNPSNSTYGEGDSVGQRLLQVYNAAGSHTVEFEYDFTKSNIHAYDFLGSVDTTQPGGLLAECGNPPSFLSGATCSSLYSSAVPISIPTDPFDSVALRETAGRVLRIGGSSTTPTVTIVGHDPPTTCTGTCGTSAVTVRVTFSTPAPDSPIAIWFGAHLASSAAGNTGWGTGLGAANISGAPFHVSLGHGGRDNQVNLEGPIPPVVPEGSFPLLILPLSAVGVSGLVVQIRARRRRASGVSVS